MTKLKKILEGLDTNATKELIFQSKRKKKRNFWIPENEAKTKLQSKQKDHPFKIWFDWFEIFNWF